MLVLFPWTTQQMTAALSASHQDVLKSVLTSGYINMPWARIFLRSLALTKSFWYVPASVLWVMTCFLCWSPDSHVRAIHLRLCSDTCSPNGYLCSWSLTQKSEKFSPACLMLCRLCWKVTLNRAREPEAGRPWNLCGAHREDMTFLLAWHFHHGFSACDPSSLLHPDLLFSLDLLLLMVTVPLHLGQDDTQVSVLCREEEPSFT